jgi:hypothetical protein
MTPEQQRIEHIKDRLKDIATRGIGQTLFDIQDELWLLDCLLGAGVKSSTAEIDSAYDSLDNSRLSKNSSLGEQLCSIQATIGVVICALASVRSNADACNEAFKKCHETDIEPALIDALIRQPQFLDDAAAEIAMQQDDNSVTATLRRQLSNLLKKEGQANG